MGLTVDLNKPFTPEVKAYLRERGRGHLIPANERRFGEDGDREPEEHEQYDSHALSPFYNSEERAAAVYDVGGAPLPGTVLDHDTGRVADRENGVFVEYSGPGHTPGAYDLSSTRDSKQYNDGGWGSKNEDGDSDDIDEDIVAHVLAQDTVKDIKAELKKQEIESSSTKKEDLQNDLAVGLQDKRDEGKKLELG